jgi:thymidylate synthase (FAD)
MKVVNNSTVAYIDHMGSDLTVVNAARVSFDKEHDVFEESTDRRLISYLGRYGHWSPFAHTSIQVRVDAPIFVARQLVKHQVGGVWNEVSRRYVDDEPSFYLPDVWRKRAENKKQGSSDEVFSSEPLVEWNSMVQSAQQMLVPSLALYEQLLAKGVAPEQARMVLPQNTMTSWYWTGSLMFFHRVFVQRTDDHAQLETQEVAKQIGDICEQLFPVSWSALNGTQ